MARIRTIKPEFWTDRKVVNLSAHARLFFIGLWNQVDDYGCTDADPFELKLRILPLDDADPDDLMAELYRLGMVVRLTNGDETFLRVVNFEKHQKVDKRTPCRFGDPDDWTPAESHRPPPDSTDSQPSPPETSLGMEGKGKGRERKGTSGARKRATQLPDSWNPSQDDQTKLGKQFPSVDLDREMAKFRDHAKSKGRTAKDWDAAWRNWVRKADEFSNNGARASPSVNDPWEGAESGRTQL